MDNPSARALLPTQTHRRSIRLPDYDYAQEGMYYITICSACRTELFGQLVDDHVVLSDIGKIASDEWYRTPR